MNSLTQSHIYYSKNNNVTVSVLVYLVHEHLNNMQNNSLNGMYMCVHMYISIFIYMCVFVRA